MQLGVRLLDPTDTGPLRPRDPEMLLQFLQQVEKKSLQMGSAIGSDFIERVSTGRETSKGVLRRLQLRRNPGKKKVHRRVKRLIKRKREKAGSTHDWLPGSNEDQCALES